MSMKKNVQIYNKMIRNSLGYAKMWKNTIFKYKRLFRGSC